MAVRPLVAKTLRAHGFGAPGRPRGWQLLPRGILLRLGTRRRVLAPGRGRVTSMPDSIPCSDPPCWPTNSAMPMGLATRAAAPSGQCWRPSRPGTPPLLRYTLELAYWRTIAGLLRYADPEGYLAWRSERLDPGIRNDLEAIYENGALYHRYRTRPARRHLYRVPEGPGHPRGPAQLR